MLQNDAWRVGVAAQTAVLHALSTGQCLDTALGTNDLRMLAEKTQASFKQTDAAVIGCQKRVAAVAPTC